ncbi:MAG: NAD-dependent malic enzyme [Deltaproteobacteria bacterium]|nr:NAD-dependent malic enzyme [Deltaproteobacteria bacterium]
MKKNYIPKKGTDGIKFLEVRAKGRNLLHDPLLNKGTGFTKEERVAFELVGLLPAHISTLEEQLTRVYENFKWKQSNLEKYIQLRVLQDRNEVLFYALLNRHLEEMAPIIYTPTVGEAVQLHSHIFRFARGLYISPENIGHIKEMADNLPTRQIEMIVVTDNQGILGIGDQGIGGMGIPIGKLSLYTLAGGIHPSACLPISLDVGTDNEILLKDPLYLGMKHKRCKGTPYFQFIDTFVERIRELYPKALIQWEDLSKQNAFHILKQYRDTFLSFNDDIQGTGAVAVSGLLNAVKIKNEKFSDQVFCVYGAGAGGIGVSRQIYHTLLEEGLSKADAKKRIFVLDSQGLITTQRKNLDEYKRPFAQETAEESSLVNVIKNKKITVLLGLSGTPGVFNQQVVAAMLVNTNRPIIFPLSNPTSKCEAHPKDLITWSEGQVIVATGSPFEPVSYKGKKIVIGQGNNAFIFPGVGLGVLASGASKITDKMFTVATNTLAEQISTDDRKEGIIYPSIKNLRNVSIQVAKAVFQQAVKEGQVPALPGREANSKSLRSQKSVAKKPSKDPSQIIQDRMWDPIYVPFKREKVA